MGGWGVDCVSCGRSPDCWHLSLMPLALFTSMHQHSCLIHCRLVKNKNASLLTSSAETDSTTGMLTSAVFFLPGFTFRELPKPTYEKLFFLRNCVLSLCASRYMFVTSVCACVRSYSLSSSLHKVNLSG